MRLSKRLRMACAHYWLETVQNRLDDSKLNAKNISEHPPPSPDLEHMEYLLLQEQEPSDHCSLHPIYQKDKVRQFSHTYSIVLSKRVRWKLSL